MNLVTDLNFQYRKLAVRIFNYILENEPGVEDVLSQYLNDQDFEFIRELIDPPEQFFDNNGKWTLEGRPAFKQYLYEIINNKYHGLDIDKLDYLVRDSYHTGINIAVGTHMISRFVNGIGVQEIDKEQRITFDAKLADDIADVFGSRKSLFGKAYFHKKTYPIEYQLQKAIRLAAPHLKIRGMNGQLTTIKDIFIEPIDIAGYIQLDDHIFSLIKHSEIDHPDIREAKECIEKTERREIHTPIIKMKLVDVSI